MAGGQANRRRVVCANGVPKIGTQNAQLLLGVRMFRFDDLIRSSMVIRDVKRQYPSTIDVFESLGFRSICDDCSIDMVARRQGLAPSDVVAELNAAAFGSASQTSR